MDKRDKKICRKAILIIKKYLCYTRRAKWNGLTDRAAVSLFAKIEYRKAIDPNTIRGDYLTWVWELLKNEDISKYAKIIEGLSPAKKGIDIPSITPTPNKRIKKQVKSQKTRVARGSVDSTFKEDYYKWLNQAYWKGVRKTIITRDGNKCTSCGCEKLLHVHHKTYENHLNEHEHLEDLITLCAVCHDKIHGRI